MTLHWGLSKQTNIYFNHKIIFLFSVLILPTIVDGIRSSSIALQSSSDCRKERITLILFRILSSYLLCLGDKKEKRVFPLCRIFQSPFRKYFRCHIVGPPYGRVDPVAWSSPMGPVVSPGPGFHSSSIFISLWVPRTWHIFSPSGYNHLPFHLGSLLFRPSVIQLTNFSFNFYC